MLLYLGMLILLGHAIALVAGYWVSGMLYPGARIALLPDGVTPGIVLGDGLAAMAIVLHFMGVG